MKITIVLGHELPFPSKKGGGVNSLLGQLVGKFETEGNDVTVFSPKFDGLPDFEIKKGVKYVRVKGANRKENLFLNVVCGIPYFFRVLKKIEYSDVISCHLWLGFLFSIFRVAKIKTHTVHRDPKKILILFKYFDRIYFGSDSVCEDAKLLLPGLKNKFKTIYNCVDFEDYKTHTKLESKDIIKFLYIGRFSNDKGLISLFEGMKKAITLNKNISLKTIGPLNAEGGSEPKLIDHLKQFIVINKLEDSIEISGPLYNRDELDQEILKHHVIVLPSVNGETLNMVVLECMRIGRAQLISDLPANLPLNVNSKTGYFCKAGDSGSWEEQILKISKEITNGIDFSFNTYNFGKEVFSSDIICKKYIQDFEELLISKINN